jgi:hypothetical protein
MSVLDATVHSVNVAYVDMESQLDLCDIAKVARSLGVHLASPEQECRQDRPTEMPTCLPSLTRCQNTRTDDGGRHCGFPSGISVHRCGHGDSQPAGAPAPGYRSRCRTRYHRH